MTNNLIIAALAVLGACASHKSDCPTSTYEIPVGGIEDICQIEPKPSWGRPISYAGMPSDKVFSLGYATENYFFPIDTKEFILGSTSNKFRVNSVSPEKIRFTYVGTSK